MAPVAPIVLAVASSRARRQADSLRRGVCPDLLPRPVVTRGIVTVVEEAVLSRRSLIATSGAPVRSYFTEAAADTIELRADPAQPVMHSRDAVLALLRDGRSVRQIAREVGIGLERVKSHRREILRGFGVTRVRDLDDAVRRQSVGT